MTDDKREVSKQFRVERILDKDTTDTYYANCVMVRSTIYDFSFNFGQSFVDDGAKKIFEKFEKRIFMSPHQAKAFLHALKIQVDSYEANFGEIKLRTQKKGTQH